MLKSTLFLVATVLALVTVPMIESRGYLNELQDRLQERRGGRGGQSGSGENGQGRHGGNGGRGGRGGHGGRHSSEESSEEEDVIEVDIADIQQAISRVFAAANSSIVTENGTALWDLIPVVARYTKLSEFDQWNVTQAILNGTTDLSWATLPVEVQDALNAEKQYVTDPSRTLAELEIVPGDSEFANLTLSDLFKEECQPIVQDVYGAVNSVEFSTQVDVRALDEALAQVVRELIDEHVQNEEDDELVIDLEGEITRDFLRSQGLLNEGQEYKCLVEKVLHHLVILAIHECALF